VALAIELETLDYVTHRERERERSRRRRRLDGRLVKESEGGERSE
jgi:hypothetical protein